MIRVGVLGPLTVTRDGAPVTLPTPMLRRLLALLVSQAGSPIQVDAIADALWNGRPPRTARKTLAVYVHRLRKLLDSDDRIGSGPNGYWITAGPDELDTLVFDRLATRATAENDRRLADEALALFRGRPYDEFRDIEPIARIAEALTERRLALLEQRIQTDLDSGRHTELIGELHAAIAEHPYRERFRAQLMLALYRAGRQADALEQYRQTHRVLADDLGVEPVREIQELHQKILRADPGLSTSSQGWAATPRLLPRDVPDFTGREADLRWLDEVAGTPGSTAVINAIAGTAGVGKTALAVHWALRAGGRFPDGQLYINLRGYSPGPPLTPLEALGMLLRALGTASEGVPKTVDEAAALYRSLLVDREMLVLLDNAHSADQVRPLLPGGLTNLVLVTSRDRLSGLIARDGARRLTLGTLPGPESLGLMRRILGAERVDADINAALDVVRACGHLPLALRVAAARLADEPSLPLRAFADRLLGDERLRTLEIDGDPQGAVRVLFAMSVERLDPRAAVLFRRIGLLPVPEASTGVAGLLIDSAGPLLERLADASLLTLNKGHFLVHDLVHAYARELAEPADVAALRGCYEALVGWVLDADAAIPARQFPAPDHTHTSGSIVVSDPDGWFHTERELVLRAAVDAAQRGWDEPAWQLVAGMTNFAGRQNYINEWMRACEEILARIHDPFGIANLQLGLGGMLRSRGEPVPAVPLLRRARRGFVRCGDSRRAATAATQLGMAYRLMDRPGPARAAVTWAIGVLERGPVVPQLGAAYLALGNLLHGQRDYAGALDAYESAAGAMRASDDRSGLANVLAALGMALHRSGAPTARALEPLTEATGVLSGLDDPIGLCMIHCHIATVHLDAGELEQARSHGEVALGLAQDGHHAHGMRAALTVMGQIALAAGDPHTAVERFEAAILVARKTGVTQPLQRLNDLLSLARATPVGSTT